jgi:hypothetical protein
MRVAHRALGVRLMLMPGFARRLKCPPLVPASVAERDVRPAPAMDARWLLLATREAVRRGGELRIEHLGHTLWPGDPFSARRSPWTVITPQASPFTAELLAAVRKTTGLDDPAAVSFLLALLFRLPVLSHPRGAPDQQILGVGELLDAEPQSLALLLTNGWLTLGYGLWDEPSCLAATGWHARFARQTYSWKFNPRDYNHVLADLRSRAWTMLSWLPDPAAGGWVDLDALVSLAQEVWPAATTPVGPQPDWQLTDSKGHELAGAELATAAKDVWRYLLVGPARWLGLVQIAFDARDQPSALRLTPLAARVRLGTPFNEPPATGVAWGDGLEATVEPVAGNSTLARHLFAMTTYEGLEDGRLRFRWTPEKADGVFASGHSPPDIVSGFAALGAPLPEKVARAFADRWARWGRVRRYDDVALMEVGEPALLDELLATGALSGLVRFRAGPTAVVVASDEVDDLIEALRRLGHTPRVAN